MRAGLGLLGLGWAGAGLGWGWPGLGWACRGRHGLEAHRKQLTPDLTLFLVGLRGFPKGPRRQFPATPVQDSGLVWAGLGLLGLAWVRAGLGLLGPAWARGALERLKSRFKSFPGPGLPGPAWVRMRAGLGLSGPAWARGPCRGFWAWEGRPGRAGAGLGEGWPGPAGASGG